MVKYELDGDRASNKMMTDASAVANWIWGGVYSVDFFGVSQKNSYFGFDVRLHSGSGPKHIIYADADGNWYELVRDSAFSGGKLEKITDMPKLERRSLKAVLAEARTLLEDDDVFASERMPALFLKLEKAVIEKMKKLPATAPVAVQIMDGLNKVSAALKSKMTLTGKEAVETLWKAMKGTFNRDMPPIPYLYRKYGNDAVDAIVGKW